MTAVVLIMAGGTGGHVFPGLAVARGFKELGYEVQWLGASEGIENRLVPQAGIPLHVLAISGLRGKGIKSLLTMPWKLMVTVLTARRLMKQVDPVVALGFGGYASAPGAIAARLSGVPLIIHEQNAIPGLTNRLLSHLATRVLEGFAGAFAGRGIATGNPVRQEITTLPEPEQRYFSRTGPLNILILGGSQGALALNRILPGVLMKVFSPDELLVRHQTGAGRQQEAADAWQGLNVQVQLEEFIADMAQAYGWADLIICRAGASTVAEVAAVGVAALFIPLPTAVDDHQTANARWLVAQQAALLLPQSELNAKQLSGLLESWREREKLQFLAINAKKAALIDSVDVVIRHCQEVANG